MTHDEILRLLGYTLDATIKFGPLALIGFITWRIME
jgi:hypothetical protein